MMLTTDRGERVMLPDNASSISALFDLAKFLLHARIGKQIFASDFLGSRRLANQYGNIRVEVRF
jgi:hypothetical protein